MCIHVHVCRLCIWLHICDLCNMLHTGRIAVVLAAVDASTVLLLRCSGLVVRGSDSEIRYRKLSWTIDLCQFESVVRQKKFDNCQRVSFSDAINKQGPAVSSVIPIAMFYDDVCGDSDEMSAYLVVIDSLYALVMNLTFVILWIDFEMVSTYTFSIPHIAYNSEAHVLE